VQQQISPLKVQRGLSRSIFASTVGMVFFAVAMGPMLTGFALKLGATPVQIGLIGALPLIVGPVQLVAAVWLERTGKRKPLWMITTVAQRALWVPILVLPFVLYPAHSTSAMLALMALLLFSWALASFSAPYWQSWMADLIPEGQSGRFWGRRTAFCNGSAMVTSLLLSPLLDHFPDERKFIGYAIVFGVGVIFGELDLIIHWPVPEPAMVRTETAPTLWEAVKLPFLHRYFRGFIIVQIAWAAAVWVMVPFYYVFLLENLELSYLTIAVLNALGQIAAVSTSRVWGFFCDRFGSKPVLKLCYILMLTQPLVLLFCTKSNAMQILVPLAVYIGFANAGAVVAITSLVLGLPPREGKSMYIAAYNAIVQVPGAVVPVLGGLIVGAVGERTFGSGLLTIDAIKVLFLISAVMRLSVVPLMRLVAEVSDASVSHVVSQVFYGNPFRLITGMVGFASRSESRRARGARTLGRSKSPLAVEGLTKALDDPSRQVRGEAARALGAMRPQEALNPLLEKLLDPESGIRPESAEALGLLGSGEAVAPLLERLADEDPGLRESVSWALGVIGDRRAAEPLLRSLESERDPRVFAALSEALARLGEIRAIRYVLPRMRQARLPALRRQLAVAVGNLLGREGEFYRVLDEEGRTHGAGFARLVAVRRALRSRRVLFDALARAEGAYGDEDYATTVANLAEASFDVLAEVLDREGGPEVQARTAGRLDLVRMALALDEQLGTAAWFLDYVEGLDEVGREEALLAAYAFARLCAAYRRPGEGR